jgi:thiol-disulfide isomerase/thioredoxin
MTSYKKLLFLIISSILLNTCSNVEKKSFIISGNIDYIGDATISISKVPLHYKYSPKKEFIVTPDEKGNFELKIPITNDEKLLLSIDDESLLLIADKNDPISIKVKRSSFPLNTEVNSINSSDYDAYQNYLKDIQGLDNQIEKEMNKYRDGLENMAITLSEKKVAISNDNLAGTSFDDLIWKAKGELLVNKIKSIEYRFGNKGFDADQERKLILENAKSEDIFSLQSLQAQRAGIRDITHYYARTFGIYDNTVESEGRDLAEYNIKRIAYEELNAKRLEVIDYIDDRRAEAYARLFLVAERIGEIELTKAEPSYRNYLEQYNDFPEYTEFLTYFFNEIKSVSPGEPAVSFSLPDSSGNTKTLEDYRGKYILLDFWAGWCQPCLEEFPHMRDIYADFSRDDFEIIGISTEVEKAVWLDDINRFKNPWPQLYGGNGFDQETFKAYKGGGIPFYILIDRNGNIKRYNDIRATFNLREVLNTLIDEN